MIVLEFIQLMYFLLIDSFLFLYYGKFHYYKYYNGYVKTTKGIVRQYHKSDYYSMYHFKNNQKKDIIQLMRKPSGGFISKYDALFKCKPICDDKLNKNVNSVFS